MKWHEPSEKLMKRDKSEMEDDLRTEYDLKRLRVRKLGPGWKGFGGTPVRLEPDVAEMFPDADAVNKVLCQQFSFWKTELVLYYSERRGGQILAAKIEITKSSLTALCLPLLL